MEEQIGPKTAQELRETLTISEYINALFERVSMIEIKLEINNPAEEGEPMAKLERIKKYIASIIDRLDAISTNLDIL